MAIEILYEDERLLVALKPAGMLSVESPGAQGRTIVQALRSQGREVIPVHRLDRDVSGAIVLAKDAETRALLEDLFRGRKVTKTYWALVQGRLPKQTGEFRFPIFDAGSHARISRDGQAGDHALAREAALRLDDGGRSRSRDRPLQPDPASLRACGPPARRRAEVRARQGRPAARQTRRASRGAARVSRIPRARQTST